MALKKPPKKKPPKDPMRQSKLKTILFFLLVGYGLYYLYETDPPGPNPFEVKNLPSITAEPIQKKDAFPLPFEHRGWELMPVASYVITARVIAVKHYDDKFSRLAPVDVIVGWKKMANPNTYALAKINPINRYFNMDLSPSLDNYLSRGELYSSMANMHLIPYDKKTEELILALQPGMQISMIGHLVNAKSRARKLKLPTSTKRTDAGPTGSETMLVQKLVIR